MLLGIARATADSDAFDWRGFYEEKTLAFTGAALRWRSIAHTAQLAGEHDVVRMAVTNALENEMFAREAKEKALGL